MEKPLNSSPFYEIYDDSVVTKHWDSGFFSQSTLILCGILEYINNFKKLPTTVDSSQSFSWYKTIDEIDITENYFKKFKEGYYLSNDENIDFNIFYQFRDYRWINYEKITPIINQYFSPSLQITNIIDNITAKYSVDYENTCVLFYRGNDKITETPLCDYREYIHFTQYILSKKPHVKFLIQSDETEFIEYFTYLYPNNSFYFKDEIRHMKKQNSTVDKVFKDDNSLYSKYYLAITIIMSKCNYIVCGSGNCSAWIMLYRGNAVNICQNLQGKWICTLII